MDLIDRKVKVKICLVGENAVGKTSLIKKFVLDIFDDAYITTIGTKITKKTMNFDMGDETINMDMMIWDIMGQTSFRTLLQDAYFYGAHGVMAISDSTRPDTVPSLHDWLDSTKNVVGDVPVVFLSNKNDLKGSVQVDQAMLEAELGKYKGEMMFSSAKTGENVSEAFHILGKQILKNLFSETE